jgi:hypothetical protein
MKTPKQIDQERAEIEAVYTPQFRKIFNHMAAEAKTFYLAKNYVPAREISEQYYPEFLKIIREAQRAAIKHFGFDMRQQGEQKGYKFKTEKHKALIDYELRSKDEQGEITALLLLLEQEQVEKINAQFALDSAVFINKNGEEQANYVEQTNEKELNQAQATSLILFAAQKNTLTDNIEKLRRNLATERFNVILGQSPSISEARKLAMQEKINRLEKELEELIKNQKKIVADNIEKIFKDKGVARSELISSQNVGMAQSFAQNKEAQLIQQNIPEAEIKKKWESILDSRTRDTHVVADGQTVAINAKFTVGGHLAEYPRDPSLPIEETANCRCVSFHTWE